MSRPENRGPAGAIVLDMGQIEQVAGGDTQRSDGGGCTDPYPLPPWLVTAPETLIGEN